MKRFLFWLPLYAALWLLGQSYTFAQNIDSSAIHGLRELGSRSVTGVESTDHSGIPLSNVAELNTAADDLKAVINTAGVSDFRVFDYANYPFLTFLGKEADGDAMMKAMEEKIATMTPAVENYLLIGKIIDEQGKVVIKTIIHLPKVGSKSSGNRSTWPFLPPDLISKKLNDVSAWINTQIKPDHNKSSEVEVGFLKWIKNKIFGSNQFYEGVFITPMGSPVYVKFNWVYSFTDTGILSMWETQDGKIYQEHTVDGKFLGYYNLSNPQDYYIDINIAPLTANINSNIPIPINILDGTGEVSTIDGAQGSVLGNITIGTNSQNNTDINIGSFNKQMTFTNKFILNGAIPLVAINNAITETDYLAEFQGKKPDKEVLLPNFILNGDIAKGVYRWLSPSAKPIVKNEFSRFANKAQEVGINILSSFIDAKTFEWKLEYEYPPFFVRKPFNSWELKDIRRAIKGLDEIKNNVDKLKKIKYYSASQGGVNKSAYVNSILAKFSGSFGFMMYPLFKDLTLDEKKDYCDFYTAQGNAITDLHQNAFIYVLRAAVEQNQHRELFNHIKGQTKLLSNKLD